MLCLSRRIGASESINVRVHYRKSPALIRLLESNGICPSVLDGICDVVQVEPLRMAWIKGDRQIVIGIKAEDHVQIVRSEIDET